MPRPILVLEHQRNAPPALLGEWAAARDLPLTVVAVDEAAELPGPEEAFAVVTLGSERAAYDDTVPWLAREAALLRRAIGAGVPVLGLCFGSQHLARVLGGAARRAPHSEVGWHRVDTDIPELIAPGPWMQWHHDAFALPPGAVELARSTVGPQAFRSGPHLGIQFHPEVTPDVVAGWAAGSADELAAAGLTPAALTADTQRHAAAARGAAWRLFDGFAAGTSGAGR